MSDDPAATSWHLDKRVPLVLIGAIIAQTFGLGWWASSISSRVDQIELRMAEQGDLKGRIVTMETHLIYIRQSLDEIRRSIERDRRVDHR